MATSSRRLSRTLAALSGGSAHPPDARVPADEAAARFSAAVHDGAGGWGRWPALEGEWGQERQEARWEPTPDGRGGTLGVNRDPPGEPDPPGGWGEFSYGGAVTGPVSGFTPGLKGTNGVRLRCGPWLGEPGRPRLESPWKLAGRGELVEGFSLTIASFRGALMGPGSDPEDDRGVQIHIDTFGMGADDDTEPERDRLQSGGLIFYLVRGARPRDSEIYPIDAYGQPSLSHLDDDEKRQLHEDLLNEQLEHRAPFVTKPCMCLAHHRVDPAEYRGEDGFELGLYLLDDARCLCWTLNGKLMDTFDMGDYMEPVRERDLFLSVMAIGGNRQNRWELSGMEMLAAE